MSRVPWFVYPNAWSSLDDTYFESSASQISQTMGISKTIESGYSCWKGLTVWLFFCRKWRRPHVSIFLRHNLLSLRQSKFLWRGESPKRRMAAIAAEEGTPLDYFFAVRFISCMCLLYYVLPSLCPAYSCWGHSWHRGQRVVRLDAEQESVVFQKKYFWVCGVWENFMGAGDVKAPPLLLIPPWYNV